MYLKKTLEMLGLSVLICFSFFLTEKTTTVIKDNDEIMINLKDISKEKEILSVDAKIENNEIIPGISGKVVDIEKSYQAMKKIGTYNDNLIVYKEITPSISINDNYDKYVVSGNNNKNMVSLIFKLEEDIKINNIIDLLVNKDTKANFFVSTKWVENNMEVLKVFSNNNYVIGNIEEYDNENNYWLNTTIKRISKQAKYYCYSENKDELLLSSCSNDKYYTILPTIIVENNLLSTIKKEISNGSIISIEINDNTLKELSNTIDYINSKGYKIVSLDTLLDE